MLAGKIALVPHPFIIDLNYLEPTPCLNAFSIE